MPRGPNINLLNNLTPPTIFKLPMMSREYELNEGTMLSRLVLWAASQGERMMETILRCTSRHRECRSQLVDLIQAQVEEQQSA